MKRWPNKSKKIIDRNGDLSAVCRLGGHLNLRRGVRVIFLLVLVRDGQPLSLSVRNNGMDQSVHYLSLSLESLMSAFTRYALKFNISVLFLSLFLFISGCGTDGNTVIQPSSQEPTAEEEAAYEEEIEEMLDERE